MYILGLNAYHADSSAALIKDGQLVIAVEEERFNRVKHWSGFPTEAIKHCLDACGITAKDIDYVAINRNPKANLLKKIAYVLAKRPSISTLKDRLRNKSKIGKIADEFQRKMGLDSESKAKFRFIEHHRAHLSSSFLVSPFQKSALISVDGFGDFLSCMMAMGNENDISIFNKVPYPHSLGIFYLAITQYLGFPAYGAEYKVMGLAPYGKPAYINEMRKIVLVKDDGAFELDLDYFRHHDKSVDMAWENTAPTIGCVFTDKLVKLLGPAREKGEEVTQRHKDIAASLQAMYEEAFFAMLNKLYDVTKSDNLCVAGGCAMNSVANGKILDNTAFKNIYIQPAAGDAGGSIGAAFYMWHSLLGNKRNFIMEHAYWGPRYNEDELREVLDSQINEIKACNCSVNKFEDADLCKQIAKHIADGKVIGWFQDKMEWGPRALGNRSILCDPRRADMKEILNIKIKRRESFRPFAPSILRESVKDWFEKDCDVPFMLQVLQIKKEKRKEIPAVTHVNGSGRLQTVTETQNPLYYNLIREFYDITNVPILLNTSFNENEPIVCHPKEALDCFLRTNMDVLALGNFVVKR
ncbi:MAG TPA: carbamoyltransferase [Phycisphaerales bacterium]|nr:carbamoyltransferase [Phycisphaerales bacterium]